MLNLADDQHAEPAARAEDAREGRAPKNGVSRDEIREVFLQVAIYAGVPAARRQSFRIAREAFAGAATPRQA